MMALCMVIETMLAMHQQNLKNNNNESLIA